MDHLIKYGYEVLEEQACFDEQMDVLRQNMETGQFQRIWNSGRALTMEQHRTPVQVSKPRGAISPTKAFHGTCIRVTPVLAPAGGAIMIPERSEWEGKCAPRRVKDAIWNREGYNFPEDHDATGRDQKQEATAL